MNQAALLSLAALIIGAGLAPEAQASKKPSRQVLEPKLVEIGHKAPPRHRRGYRQVKPLRAKVWTDVGEGAVLYPGEAVRVFFRVSRDAYVTVYDLQPNGKIKVLFPRGRDDGYVAGGVTIGLPDRYSRTQLVVRGRPGIERIRVVASDTPYRDGVDPRWLNEGRRGYNGASAGPGASMVVPAGGRGKPRLVREELGRHVAEAETHFVVARRRACRPRW